jgi:subtilisin family serine protease
MRSWWRAALVVAVIGAGAPTVVERAGEVVVPSRAELVSGSYLVALRDTVAPDEVGSTARSLVRRYGGSLGHVYSRVMRGFAVHTSLDGARRLAGDPSVQRVEQDTAGHLTGRRNNPPSWGLDRIDERTNRFDYAFRYPNSAPSVHVYVLDSGIRISHQDFGGRATYGTSAVGQPTPSDCHDHGTHVAGTIGGATYGVAPLVQLVAVQVTTCDLANIVTGEAVIAGLEYVGNEVHEMRDVQGRSWPAVGNMSFRISAGAVTMATQALQYSINYGITWVVAAGNDNLEGCDSPWRSDAITVAATDSNDARWDGGPHFGSNFGSCVDLFAPGKDIMSLSNSSDWADAPQSGTSMAAAHVSGVAAQILEDHPTWTPLQVRDAIVNDATPGVVTNAGNGSPNLLLHGWPGPVVEQGMCESQRGSIRCAVSSTGSAIATVAWYRDGRLMPTTRRTYTFGCRVGTTYEMCVVITDANLYSDTRVQFVTCNNHNF